MGNKTEHFEALSQNTQLMKNLIFTIGKIFIFIFRLIFYPIRILNNIIYGPLRPNLVGYAWYSKDQYPKIIDSSHDSLDELVPTYELWSSISDNNIEEYHKKGWVVIKVNIEIADLKKWLKKYSLLNTGENRQKYVNYRLKEFLKNTII